MCLQLTKLHPLTGRFDLLRNDTDLFCSLCYSNFWNLKMMKQLIQSFSFRVFCFQLIASWHLHLQLKVSCVMCLLFVQCWSVINHTKSFDVLHFCSHIFMIIKWLSDSLFLTCIILVQKVPAGRILEFSILHLAMSEITVVGTRHQIAINEVG